MGEIRITSPCKTRGYPYPVCKNKISFTVCATKHSKDDNTKSDHTELLSGSIQSNFNGSNTFGTMKISSRQG